MTVCCHLVAAAGYCRWGPTEQVPSADETEGAFSLEYFICMHIMCCYGGPICHWMHQQIIIYKMWHKLIFRFWFVSVLINNFALIAILLLLTFPLKFSIFFIYWCIIFPLKSLLFISIFNLKFLYGFLPSYTNEGVCHQSVSWGQLFVSILNQ